MPNWRVRNVRFTVFLMPETVVPNALWRDVVGDDPESSQVQRPIATKLETGPFGDGRLLLIVQPGRIEWRCEALMQLGASDDPLLGRYPEAEVGFIELISRWTGLPAFPLASRIALGEVLASAVASPQDGYRELQPLIDAVPHDLDRAADFLYQVNRPRRSRSAVDRLEINRLSKWAVQSWQSATISSGTTPTTGAKRYECAVETDISTSAEFSGPLPLATIPALVAELVEAGHEVIEHGDHL